MQKTITDNKSTQRVNKPILHEVSYIRPVVIFLLVVYHSFCMYDGKWSLPDGVQHVEAYRYLSFFISGFRIETIAMVAGYVFAFQCLFLNKRIPFKDFAKKKAFRLLLPCLVFSIIYYFIFYFHKGSFSIVDFCIKLSNGCGHLWFLPMLFWCFIGLWIIDHYHFDSFKLLLFLGIISLIPNPIRLFGIQRATYFMFYAYLGFCLWKYRPKLINYINMKLIIGTIILYIIFVLLNDYISHVNFSNIYFRIILLNTLNMITSLTGLIMIYSIFMYIVNKGSTPPLLGNLVQLNMLWCLCFSTIYPFTFIPSYYYSSINKSLFPSMDCFLNNSYFFCWRNYSLIKN